MTHLLVTNDFPPKVGGIQSYLFDLWSQLDPNSFCVLAHDEEGAAAFDAGQPFRIERVPAKLLLPTPAMRRRIDRLATEIGASLVVLDPALPIGAIGPSLSKPYALVLHGAEVTVPARLPLTRRLLRHVIGKSRLVIAAGGYPAGEVRALLDEAPELVVVPPPVDVARFRPLEPQAKAAARAKFGVDADATLIVSLSRLVPRKGMDVLIEATARLARERPGLEVVIGGSGRDEQRLRRLVSSSKAPVRLLGRVPPEDLPDLLGTADLFVMLCRNRWLGLEQEGFGIVFIEAAASGVPQVAGRSGGAGEAVIEEQTGLIVDRPADARAAQTVIARLLDDAQLRERLAAKGPEHAAQFASDLLATRLADAISRAGG